MNLPETLKSDIGIGLNRIDAEAKKLDPEGHGDIEALTKKIRDDLELLYSYHRI